MTYCLVDRDVFTNSIVGDSVVSKEVFYGFLSSFHYVYFEFRIDFNCIYIFKDNFLIAVIRNIL